MEATKPVADLGVLKYASMSPQEFVDDFKRRWNAVEEITGGILRRVDTENLSPVEGARILACVTGETFGYQEFHGSILTAPIAEIANALSVLPTLGRKGGTH